MIDITENECEINETILKNHVYTKGIELFPLPENGVKDYDLNIDARYVWLDVSNSYIFSYEDNITTIYPIPYINPKNIMDSISYVLDRVSNTIQIRTGTTGWDGYRAFIVVKYYK